MKPYHVAIVGAGFSGTMAAVELARRSNGRLRIALIERSGVHGPGLAYGTPDGQHLLNVPAARMGAFAENPGHFLDWLRVRPRDNMPLDGYVQRKIYGEYLRDILAAHRSIERVQADIVDIVPQSGGYELTSAEETRLAARQVVLALGNFPPGKGGLSPYDPAVLERLSEPGNVFLIGTGLTSLDLLVTMVRMKPQGTIHILSRSGLLPQVHEPLQPYQSFLDPGALPTTVLDGLTALRREIRAAQAKGINWQSVFDSLRPLTPALWQALPQAERRKFLRRLRSFWDTHRHRCAPEVMAAHDLLAKQGRLFAHRGDFVSLAQTPQGAAVTWRPHGTSGQETMLVDFAVDCTGPQSDCRKLDDPLVRNLLGRDLLSPDALGLGADTDAQGRLKDRTGKIVEGLYTIGFWRRGSLYETVAVRELREQAAALAEVIL